MSEEMSYVDQIFFNLVDGKKQPKPFSTVDCSNGIPESLPRDRVLILENYKKDKVRGRKDKLENNKTLAMFHTGKHPLIIPIDQGLKMADYMHSYFTSLFRTYTPSSDTPAQE